MVTIYKGTKRNGEVIYGHTEAATIKALEDAGGGKYWNSLHKFGFEVNPEIKTCWRCKEK